MVNSLGKNFDLVARVVGFIVDAIALAALINSGINPVVPLTNVQLGMTTKFAILAIMTVTYFGILREVWLRKSGELQSKSFKEFVFYDVFLHFEQWYWWIPFIILLFFFVTLLIEMTWWAALLTVFLLFFGIALIASIQMAVEIESEPKKTERREEISVMLAKQDALQALNSKEHLERWISRIDNELKKDSFTTSFDLSNTYIASVILCEAALEKYHLLYSSHKDLSLLFYRINPDQFDPPREVEPSQTRLTVLTLIDPTKDEPPWLENTQRYFTMRTYGANEVK